MRSYKIKTPITFYPVENLFGGLPKTGSDNRKASVSVL
ncbi:hypothetical protein GGP81_003116 [Salinibacter ruber]|nr:hypothetical protein [Salinibacter ruber]